MAPPKAEMEVMRSILFLIAAVALSAVLLQAAPLCSLREALQAQPQENTYVLPRGASLDVKANQSDQKMAAEIRDAIAAASTTVAAYVRVPKKVGIDIGPLGSDFEYNHETQRISLARSFALSGLGKDFVKHPKYVVATALHEYGHAVFEENTLDVLGAERKIYFETWPVYLKATEELESIEDISRKEDLSSAEREKLESRYIELQKKVLELLDLYNANGSAFQTIFIASRYDELFADLLGVLAQDDAGAYKSALSSSGFFQLVRKAEQNPEKYELNEKDLEDLKMKIRKFNPTKPQWHKVEARNFGGRRKVPDASARGDAHDYFAGARREIGRLYLKNARYRNRKAFVLRGVLEAIQQELQEVKKNPGLYEQMSPSDAGARLMRRVEELLPP